LIFLGKILKVRGNRGEVIITSPGTSASVLSSGETVLLKSEKHQNHFTIEGLREIKGALVLKIEGIDTINDALKLVGYSIFSPNAETDTSTMDTDSDSEYPGLMNFIVKDIENDIWGKVVRLETGSINILLEVGPNDGSDEIFYVPFNDTIIKEIDRESRIIIIDPPAGLKDLNRK
jgi:16S rRNA processing protein RimM